MKQALAFLMLLPLAACPGYIDGAANVGNIYGYSQQPPAYYAPPPVYYQPPAYVPPPPIHNTICSRLGNGAIMCN